MRHIAVNFYESFESTEWAEREYNFLTNHADLEFGEILAVYTVNGIRIARFRRYVDVEESRARSYVASRLGMKITGETTELIRDTKKDILLGNLKHHVNQYDLIKKAEKYARENEDIRNILNAYRDLDGYLPVMSDTSASASLDSVTESTSEENNEAIPLHESGMTTMAKFYESEKKELLDMIPELNGDYPPIVPIYKHLEESYRLIFIPETLEHFIALVDNFNEDDLLRNYFLYSESQYEEDVAVTIDYLSNGDIDIKMTSFDSLTYAEKVFAIRGSRRMTFSNFNPSNCPYIVHGGPYAETFVFNSDSLYGRAVLAEHMHAKGVKWRSGEDLINSSDDMRVMENSQQIIFLLDLERKILTHGMKSDLDEEEQVCIITVTQDDFNSNEIEEAHITMQSIDEDLSGIVIHTGDFIHELVEDNQTKTAYYLADNDNLEYLEEQLSIEGYTPIGVARTSELMNLPNQHGFVVTVSDSTTGVKYYHLLTAYEFKEREPLLTAIPTLFNAEFEYTYLTTKSKLGRLVTEHMVKNVQFAEEFVSRAEERDVVFLDDKENILNADYSRVYLLLYETVTSDEQHSLTTTTPYISAETVWKDSDDEDEEDEESSGEPNIFRGIALEQDNAPNILTRNTNEDNIREVQADWNTDETNDSEPTEESTEENYSEQALLIRNFIDDTENIYSSEGNEGYVTIRQQAGTHEALVKLDSERDLYHILRKLTNEFGDLNHIATSESTYPCALHITQPVGERKVTTEIMELDELGEHDKDSMFLTKDYLESYDYNLSDVPRYMHVATDGPFRAVLLTTRGKQELLLWELGNRGYTWMSGRAMTDETVVYELTDSFHIYPELKKVTVNVNYFLDGCNTKPCVSI